MGADSLVTTCGTSNCYFSELRRNLTRK